MTWTVDNVIYCNYTIERCRFGCDGNTNHKIYFDFVYGNVRVMSRTCMQCGIKLQERFEQKERNVYRIIDLSKRELEYETFTDEPSAKRAAEVKALKYERTSFMVVKVAGTVRANPAVRPVIWE